MDFAGGSEFEQLICSPANEPGNALRLDRFMIEAVQGRYVQLELCSHVFPASQVVQLLQPEETALDLVGAE